MKSQNGLIDQLINRFMDVNQKYYEAQLAGNWRKASALAKQFHKIYLEITQQGNIGRDALLNLDYYNHSEINGGVKLVEHMILARGGLGMVTISHLQAVAVISPEFYILNAHHVLVGKATILRMGE